MKNLFARFIKEEEGQDLIEYALLAAFIAVVAVAMVRPSALGSTPSSRASTLRWLAPNGRALAARRLAAPRSDSLPARPVQGHWSRRHALEQQFTAVGPVRGEAL